VTSRVDEAGTRGGLSEPTPQLVLGYVSLRHSLRASARTALAYSNIRRIWWSLAYLDLPFLFVLFSGVLALQTDIFVSLGNASGQLNRAGQPGAVKAPQAARLTWLVFAIDLAAPASRSASRSLSAQGRYSWQCRPGGS